jgi:hypothetical protein
MARDHLEQGGYKKLTSKKCVRMWTELMWFTEQNPQQALLKMVINFWVP